MACVYLPGGGLRADPFDEVIPELACPVAPDLGDRRHSLKSLMLRSVDDSLAF